MNCNSCTLKTCNKDIFFVYKRNKNPLKIVWFHSLVGRIRSILQRIRIEMCGMFAFCILMEQQNSFHSLKLLTKLHPRVFVFDSNWLSVVLYTAICWNQAGNSAWGVRKILCYSLLGWENTWYYIRNTHFSAFLAESAKGFSRKNIIHALFSAGSYKQSLWKIKNLQKFSLF